ncbi:MAG TPA: hypothetical protein PLJ60_02420 [Chryseolinea sp.]|nr:hypothetical protein [Chryseolinea sp.]
MKNLFSLIFLATIIFSCQKSKPVVEDTVAPVSLEDARSAFFNNLKAPAEAAAILQATGAEFNASLINDHSKYPQYAKDKVKAAANLGIYLSDLNYSVAYKESANTKELFTAALELSREIGVEQTVLDFLLDRYTKNIAQNDSVKNLVISLYLYSTENLKDTEQEKLVGIAMAAYQIENLHLALGLISTYPKDMLTTDARTQILVPVFRMVLDQKANVENIYGFLKSISDPAKPNFDYYATAFQDLISTYDKLNITEKLANNEGLELMKDEVALELSEKVEAIRAKVVSVE